MLEFLTRKTTTNIAKIAVVVRNMRFDQHFANEAIRFTMM